MQSGNRPVILRHFVSFTIFSFDLKMKDEFEYVILSDIQIFTTVYLSFFFYFFVF